MGPIDPSPLIPWMPLPFLAVATVCDLRTREIPDAIPVALLGWALLATALGWNDIGVMSLAGGFMLAFVVGLVLYALGGFGGGDVKLVAALGAATGHAAILPALFWVAIVGGVLSLIAKSRGRADLAYAPAIALGFLCDRIYHLGTVPHATPY